MALALLLAFVPLLAALAIVLLVLAAGVNTTVRGLLTRVALAAFRTAVEREGHHRIQRKRTLRAIHARSTYPVYASRTLLFSLLLGISGAILGVYIVVLGYVLLGGSPEARELATLVSSRLSLPLRSPLGPAVRQLLAMGAGSLVFAFVGLFGTYYYRWWSVSNREHRRELLIDESLARTISFVYALSRSGMIFPEIMRTVGANRRAFGESAEEIGVVVKDMDLFGADLVTALRRIASRTPSEQFADFAENFANALQGGQHVSQYLREQYDQYQAERVANQERILELFTALGEAYVAGLVAGPLFLLTALTIFGLLTGEFIAIIALVIYLLVPLGNLGFLRYLDSVSGTLTTYQAPMRRTVTGRPLSVRRRDASIETDGGFGTTVDNLDRLAAYNRLRLLRRAVVQPFELIVSEPRLLLVVSIPVAIALVALRARPVLDGGVDARLLDDLVIQSTLFVVATFAVVQELNTRRLRNIEGAIPDFLERLASTNEAGMTFTQSLKRVDRSDLGPLNPEVERLIADVSWGARTELALSRFNQRIGSTSVARVVALLTNAMAASGDLAPVIRIAANEAREDRRLGRKRRQEMFMYVLIIYLSFFVFLGIAVALQLILIPSIPGPEQLGAFTSTQAEGSIGVNFPVSPVSGAEKGRYTIMLFHAAVVQAVASGLVAGKMGQGHLASGAKHVTIMLGIAYAVFLVL